MKATKLMRLLEAARKDKGTPCVFQPRNPGARAVRCAGPKEYEFYSTFEEALHKGEIDRSRISYRELFESLVPDGREIVNSWNPRHGGGGVTLQEAGIDTAAFTHISGQIVFSEILAAFDDPQYLAPMLARNTPTQFSGERIPGIARLGDEAEVVGEGQSYPMVGTSEEWIDTPETTKRGFIVPVTKEAIFFDRTGLVLERARETSTWMAVNKEKRVIDAAVGAVDLYRRNGSAAIATYGDNSGSHDWDNLAASNTLTDWTDIENALLLFDGMTDPNTGEPIVINAPQVLVPTALLFTARRIINTTEIRFGDGASNTTQTMSANPASGYTILSNPYVKARTTSASTWFIGDFMGALRYMENWPITAVEAPANSEAEFTQDIVQRFKVSERGAVAVVEPRKLVKCT